jgi:hypothetical protein
MHSADILSGLNINSKIYMIKALSKYFGSTTYEFALMEHLMNTMVPDLK